MKINRKIFKIPITILSALGLIFPSAGIANIRSVYADQDSDSQKIIVQSVGAEICEGGSVCFFEDDRFMAEMELLIGEDRLVPIENEEVEGAEETQGVEFVLPEFEEEYELVFHFIDIDGNFEIRQFQVNDLVFEKEQIPGDQKIRYNVENDGNLIVDAFFAPFDGHGPGGDSGQPPHHNGPHFEIIAEFEGVSQPLVADGANNFIIPTNFRGGEVQFKAKVCESNEGQIIPDDEHNECVPDSERLEPLHVEGMIIKGNVNEVFSVSEDRHTLTIKEPFFEYARAGLHLLHDDNMDLNFFVNLTMEDVIVISAESDLTFVFDVGSAYSAEAFFSSSRKEGDISIFFGNNKTSLRASGEQVDGITRIVKGVGNVRPDGTAEIILPPLSAETTSQVSVEILLQDGSKVVKDVNIIRTAFRLHNYPDHGLVEASYIVHKAYLYQNQNHNDAIFDAYLQVLFYRDDKVIGYKQVQIDDEEFVNSLGENESAEMFAGFGNIILYDAAKDTHIKNPTKIAAFLTNGKIKYGKKLPSIEFGIGSGVILELGDK